MDAVVEGVAAVVVDAGTDACWSGCSASSAQCAIGVMGQTIQESARKASKRMNGAMSEQQERQWVVLADIYPLALRLC